MRDAAGEIGEQKAGNQVKPYLNEAGREVILHAKELEAAGEKDRIAGEADDGGIMLAAGAVERIAAVQKQVFGDAAVDEAVDLNFEANLECPQAQSEAGSQRKAVTEQSAEEPGGVRVALELTPRSGFHTIRTLTACGGLLRRWGG